MRNASSPERSLVVELSRRGKLVVGEPFFTPGVPLVLDRKGLADDLCSLRPSVDRACVTVEFPPHGDPLFYRSTIRSRHRLAYGQVERILSGNEAVEGDLAQALRATDELATELRRLRFARGALRIERPEVNFEFDG